jgi:hypothetical protein
VQAYSARGRPFNDQSEQYGVDLRQAQNDVLAAVGAVVRKHGTSPERTQNRKDQDAPTQAAVITYIAPLFKDAAFTACTSWPSVLLYRAVVSRALVPSSTIEC